MKKMEFKDILDCNLSKKNKNQNFLCKKNRSLGEKIARKNRRIILRLISWFKSSVRHIGRIENNKLYDYREGKVY